MAIIQDNLSAWGDVEKGKGRLVVFFSDTNRHIDHIEVQQAYDAQFPALFPVRLIAVLQGTPETILFDQIFQPATTPYVVNDANGQRYDNDHASRTSNVEIRSAYPA